MQGGGKKRRLEGIIIAETVRIAPRFQEESNTSSSKKENCLAV
jgi:hypothetical protein